jgi:uncharacterized protein (DUF1697 family)
VTQSGVALLRGINVGGRNPVRMPDLVACITDAGFGDVRTHQQSGNVIFTAEDAGLRAAEKTIEHALETTFAVAIPTIVRSRAELSETVAKAPVNHGSKDLRSEVIFLKHPLTAESALAQFPELREGVDSVAPGPGAIYFSRVAARATKTRIARLMAMPLFQQMTMRSWRTTTRLLGLLDA